MERLEAIENLIEVGRDEAPRIVAERSREAVDAVEAGVAAALEAARKRLRPEPRRTSVARMLVIGLVSAIALTVIGFVLAAVVSQVQRRLRQRQASGRFDPLVQEAERVSVAPELDAGGDDGPMPGTPARVAIPVGGSGTPDKGLLVGSERQERATA